MAIPAPPLLMIGMEGVWGTFLCVAILYPLAYYLPGNDHGCYENFENTIAMIRNSTTIQIWFVVYFFVIFGCKWDLNYELHTRINAVLCADIFPHWVTTYTISFLLSMSQTIYLRPWLPSCSTVCGTPFWTTFVPLPYGPPTSLSFTLSLSRAIWENLGPSGVISN